MRQNKLNNNVLLTLFASIIVIQILVPFLGYITLGMSIIGIQISIIQFTVALAALLLGPKGGAILGGIWGLMSFVHAWTLNYSIGAIIFRNPVIAIIPRILVGLIIGILFKKIKKTNPASLALYGGLASFINTLFVTILIYLFTIFFHLPLHHENNLLWWILSSLVGVNGIAEIITGIVIFPIIARPIIKHYYHIS